jgi:organic radical activating enzyme
MSKIDPNKLLISSDFYTIQGEGISSGIPAYFVRLGICNLTCGMSRAFTNALAKEASLEDGEIFEGDLVKEGKATWTCDSTSQWLWRGEDKDFQYLLDRFKEEGVYDDILDGLVHIIWTGGEPTIKGHQVAINNFTEYWMDVEGSLRNTFYEIETNGTVIIEEELFQSLDQINCSPKLANSGMTEKQRIVPKAIERIMQHPNYQFKFVISTEDDVKELFRDFVEPFNIPLKNVVCMPGLDDAANFEERTRFVMEMAKKYRFRGLTRLHIAAWDKTLNV